MSDTSRVIKVSKSQWNMMLMLKDNIKCMSLRNQEGKCDTAIRKEKSILRSYFQEVINS